MGLLMSSSTNEPLSSLGDNGQARHLTEQARSGAINQRNQKEQENGTIQTHHNIQADPFTWAKAPLQQIRENQHHIEHNSLHSVEPHVPTEIGVPHNDKVKSEEYQEAIEGEALEDANGRDQGLDEELKWGVLR